MVNMFTKFGEGSMYTLGDMLRTKCAGRTDARTHARTELVSISPATMKIIIVIEGASYMEEQSNTVESDVKPQVTHSLLFLVVAMETDLD